MELTQFPEPGKHLLRCCGDTLEIRLQSNKPVRGQAFLSTNIGNAILQRQETMEWVENRIPPSGQDWANLPMQRIDEYNFKIRLALAEEGHFEAKACVLSEDESEPLWVRGENLHINVEPAAYTAANSIYCAFVRQFGINKNREFSELPRGLNMDEVKAFDANSFALIPPSGTFRSLIPELNHIIHRMKCRIIHLLPINPTPTVYARMGRYGSPYASLDFTAVDPALAEFDRKATPLDQFMELADAIHRENAKLFIDIAINHTGWAAKIHEEHPDWLVREDDGSIHSPGAWGVVWGDLTELDHGKLDLWKYLADVFLTWCARGVDGFRCDAGYMIPENAWKYIIARVRNVFPETVFLLEGLGGDPAVTENLLDRANMNWAYSELFQNYSRMQIEGYLKYAWQQSSSHGLMVHYAETHDNNRLAAVSHTYASLRTALAALTSVSGAFGFVNGVEWYAREKIDVHESSALNWGAACNQIDLIRRLNSILAYHPAFFNDAMKTFLDSGNSNAVVLSRNSGDYKHNLLILFNLDCERSAQITWDASRAPFDEAVLHDLISQRRITPCSGGGHIRSLSLPAGGFLCLSNEAEMLQSIQEQEQKNELYDDILNEQEARAAVLRAVVSGNKSVIMRDCDPRKMAEELLEDPEEFLQNLYSDRSETPFVVWNWQYDTRREVILPPGYCLLVKAPWHFRFTLQEEAGNAAGKILIHINSIRRNNGSHFALIMPPPDRESRSTFRRLIVNMRVFRENASPICSTSSILLPSQEPVNCQTFFTRDDIFRHSRVFLQGNGCGAIIHQQVEIGKLESRYDAILLANLSKDYPEDRHIMFRRIRFWMIYHARFQEVKHEHIRQFYVAEDGSGVWDYQIPAGNGCFVNLTLQMKIVPGRNAVQILFHRNPADPLKHDLPDAGTVRLIVRPDIEDRNFHYATKAAQGPEREWPLKIRNHEKGFVFAPAPERVLTILSSKGKFKRGDEWIYMVHLKNEESRGLDPLSDLYSPGHFDCLLNGGDSMMITADIGNAGDKPLLPEIPAPFRKIPCFSGDLRKVMLHAIGNFIVKRDSLKTVIAGYPWFLDWGRDTLIAARGLIAAPEFREDVRHILLQFAKFERNGTIPNMISGSNADNRDTSDAPLWLFTAINDYCNAVGSKDFLNTIVRENQTLLDILESMAESIRKGTPNGIKCDPASGLVFSPPHFTWMDTNYPAGTPREGYPIEIQALWYAALKFLAACFRQKDPVKADKWQTAANEVKGSIQKFYVLPGMDHLSDCLHASPGTPAYKATADDHLRPNQLLAITLGAVDDKALCRNIINSCFELLIPGAIRSLSARPVKYLLPVYGRDGNLLNDPANPYRGRYEGNEDTSRKVAYHNGTAWTWQFPMFSEAYYLYYGKEGIHSAKAILQTMIPLMSKSCIMNLPEIIDGDLPHTFRGCDAQAWGMTELFRVWTLLQEQEL